MRAISPLFFAVRLLAFMIALLPGQAFAQASGAEQTGPTFDIPLLRAEARLVVVDVTVQDRSGRPIHGLKREDFTITEDKQPQTTHYFEEYTSQTQIQSGPKLPPMPPGTFTDYVPVPAHGALNILLLDSLNTPIADQSYVRNQLRQYVKKVSPGTRIAIFGLSQRLFLLQGFSSDPEILKNAVEHKLAPRSSSLLDSTDAATDSLSDIAGSVDNGAPSAMDVASALGQFEVQQQAFQTQLRVQYTLDAFNALAHYLSAFPGRKNLIWFSGSFPINILPDPSLNTGFAVMENNNPEFRETTNLLSRAQVAVYPLDARGLMTDPTSSAAATFSSIGLKDNQPGKTSAAFYQSQANEHMTMTQLAEDTGGAAFYNANDLATAVASAIESGANYYTLSYTPLNKNQDGSYRAISVTLNGSLRTAGYSLSYRHGYYTNDLKHPSNNSASVAVGGNSAPAGAGNTYTRAAMAHGAPAPSDILFKVRILPIGATPEQTLAPANQTDPAHPIKPPFRRFAVDLAAVGNDFQFVLDPSGRRTGAIELDVLLYDNDGVLLNATGKKVEINLTPESYKRFLAGVNAHFEISVPVKGAGDFFRIGVHDVTSNRFGVVEVPVASVARLTPLPPAAETPAVAPAGLAPATPKQILPAAAR